MDCLIDSIEDMYHTGGYGLGRCSVQPILKAGGRSAVQISVGVNGDRSKL